MWRNIIDGGEVLFFFSRSLAHARAPRKTKKTMTANTDPLDLFKLCRATNAESGYKIWFRIEACRARGEYKVIAIQNWVHNDQFTGKQLILGDIITAPSMPLARKALKTARSIVESAPSAVESQNRWEALCAEIDRVPPLSHAEASGRRNEECQQKVLDSFRSEPLVTFGRVSCTRRDIEAFFVVREKQTFAVLLTLKSGNRLVCWTDTAGKEKEAYRVRDKFLRLANQQYIDAELAKQTSVQTPVARAAVEPLVPPAPRDAGSVAANAVEDIDDDDDDDAVMEQEEDDEDADVDDKSTTKPSAEEIGTPIKLGEVPPLEAPLGADEDGGGDDGKESLLNVVPAVEEE
jgi:hypothetical protein